jgi:hypothetical protein
MPDKEKTTYICQVRCIKTELLKTEIDLHLTEFMMDFEKGLLNAFQRFSSRPRWLAVISIGNRASGSISCLMDSRPISTLIWEFHKLVR